ncbi:uncharacterized protein LOC110392697 [Numida meleagris]|uniref:uncharacterized protein LOC110392697 n=1 Tax=Numida meleagris TaxID=8996 RepID=UPI000B3DE5CB|nr:uncharacterized protein LOC110392697 [Numida meleagris]
MLPCYIQAPDELQPAEQMKDKHVLLSPSAAVHPPDPRLCLLGRSLSVTDVVEADLIYSPGHFWYHTHTTDRICNTRWFCNFCPITASVTHRARGSVSWADRPPSGWFFHLLHLSLTASILSRLSELPGSFGHACRHNSYSCIAASSTNEQLLLNKQPLRPTNTQQSLSMLKNTDLPNKKIFLVLFYRSIICLCTIVVLWIAFSLQD